MNDLFFSDDQINQALDYEDELKAIISEQFGDSPVFAIKDPRICLLFPLYEKALKALDEDIHVLMAYRNPLEVVRSLKARNDFSYEKGFALCAKYFLWTEYHSRGYKQAFVDFDDLVANPSSAAHKISEKLELNLSDLISGEKKDIRDFIKPDLKHHHLSMVGIPGDDISGGISALIRKILQYRNDFENKNLFEKFDLLRKEFGEYEALPHPPELKKLPGIIAEQSGALRSKEKTIAEQSQTLRQKELRIQDMENSLAWRLSRKVLNFGERIFFMRTIISRAKSFDQCLKYAAKLKSSTKKKKSGPQFRYSVLFIE